MAKKTTEPQAAQGLNAKRLPLQSSGGAGSSEQGKGNKRSPPETPEKRPAKRQFKKLTLSDYNKALRALFTGTQSKLSTDVNLMAGKELIKQYIYPSGNWEFKLKGGETVSDSTAKRNDVHQVLLGWRQKQDLPKPGISEVEYQDLTTRLCLHQPSLEPRLEKSSTPPEISNTHPILATSQDEGSTLVSESVSVNNRSPVAREGSPEVVHHERSPLCTAPSSPLSELSDDSVEPVQIPRLPLPADLMRSTMDENVSKDVENEGAVLGVGVECREQPLAHVPAGSSGDKLTDDLIGSLEPPGLSLTVSTSRPPVSEGIDSPTLQEDRDEGPNTASSTLSVGTGFPVCDVYRSIDVGTSQTSITDPALLRLQQSEEKLRRTSAEFLAYKIKTEQMTLAMCKQATEMGEISQENRELSAELAAVKMSINADKSRLRDYIEENDELTQDIKKLRKQYGEARRDKGKRAAMSYVRNLELDLKRVKDDRDSEVDMMHGWVLNYATKLTASVSEAERFRELYRNSSGEVKKLNNELLLRMEERGRYSEEVAARFLKEQERFDEVTKTHSSEVEALRDEADQRQVELEKDKSEAYRLYQESLAKLERLESEFRERKDELRRTIDATAAEAQTAKDQLVEARESHKSQVEALRAEAHRRQAELEKDISAARKSHRESLAEVVRLESELQASEGRANARLHVEDTELSTKVQAIRTKLTEAEFLRDETLRRALVAEEATREVQTRHQKSSEQAEQLANEFKVKEKELRGAADLAAASAQAAREQLVEITKKHNSQVEALRKEAHQRQVELEKGKSEAYRLHQESVAELERLKSEFREQKDELRRTIDATATEAQTAKDQLVEARESHKTEVETLRAEVCQREAELRKSIIEVHTLQQQSAEATRRLKDEYQSRNEELQRAVDLTIADAKMTRDQCVETEKDHKLEAETLSDGEARRRHAELEEDKLEAQRLHRDSLKEVERLKSELATEVLAARNRLTEAECLRDEALRRALVAEEATREAHTRHQESSEQAEQLANEFKVKEKELRSTVELAAADAQIAREQLAQAKSEVETLRNEAHKREIGLKQDVLRAHRPHQKLTRDVVQLEVGDLLTTNDRWEEGSQVQIDRSASKVQGPGDHLTGLMKGQHLEVEAILKREAALSAKFADARSYIKELEDSLDESSGQLTRSLEYIKASKIERGELRSEIEKLTKKISAYQDSDYERAACAQCIQNRSCTGGSGEVSAEKHKLRESQQDPAYKQKQLSTKQRPYDLEHTTIGQPVGGRTEVTLNGEKITGRSCIRTHTEPTFGERHPHNKRSRTRKGFPAAALVDRSKANTDNLRSQSRVPACLPSEPAGAANINRDLPRGPEEMEFTSPDPSLIDGPPKADGAGASVRGCHTTRVPLRVAANEAQGDAQLSQMHAKEESYVNYLQRYKSVMIVMTIIILVYASGLVHHRHPVEEGFMIVDY